ncbi:HNH endonuclease [Clostridium gasigenes]|uniref:HNH endonuclease n=1 Tax=Clostridium gasigenes TaxID=94869 RepID=UPI0016299E4F|nr:HNH endonuclease [Clostridium gasigenes]MBB6622172.1 HNH endonuclease [Clostridium gasigenes]
MGFKKICSTCNKIKDRGTECECKRKQKAENDKYYNDNNRDKEARKIYESKRWKTTRDMVRIRDNNLCQCCVDIKRVTPIDLVHHIEPVNINSNLAYDLNNCIGLCSMCHGIAHNAYDRSINDMKEEQDYLKGLIEYKK